MLLCLYAQVLMVFAFLILQFLYLVILGPYTCMITQVELSTQKAHTSMRPESADLAWVFDTCEGGLASRGCLPSEHPWSWPIDNLEE